MKSAPTARVHQDVVSDRHQVFGLSEPVEDVHALLGADGMMNAVRFLAAFRTGKLGTALLDDLSQPYKPFIFRDWSTVNREQKDALAKRMPWNPLLREASGMGHIDSDHVPRPRTQQEVAHSEVPELDPFVRF